MLWLRDHACPERSEGMPEDVAKAKRSYTGQYLKGML